MGHSCLKRLGMITLLHSAMQQNEQAGKGQSKTQVGFPHLIRPYFFFGGFLSFTSLLGYFSILRSVDCSIDRVETGSLNLLPRTFNRSFLIYLSGSDGKSIPWPNLGKGLDESFHIDLDLPILAHGKVQELGHTLSHMPDRNHRELIGRIALVRIHIAPFN